MKTHNFLILTLFCMPFLSNGQQIVNLTATQQNIGGVPQIEVTWQTIDERNFCYFIIERDTNYSNNFITRDTLYANGNAPGQTLTYLYTDFGPLQSGITYSYRLRLDTLGNFGVCYFNRYHNDTANVNFVTSIAEQTTTPFSIFPNPTNNGEITINGNHPIRSVQIYNAIGEVIYNVTNLNSSGQFIDISEYPDGIYFITILSDNKLYYHKLIKQ